MHLNELSDRLSNQIDGLRDRTADVVGGDGNSVFREFSKLSKQLGGVEKHLDERIDELKDAQSSNVDTLLGDLHRTTWPRRLFWLAIGAAAGAVAAYLADPDRGRARREEIGGQVTAKAQEVRDQTTQQAEQAISSAKQQVEQQIDGVRDRAQDLTAQAADRTTETMERTIDRADELAREASTQAGQAANQARGAVIETVKDVTPDTPTDDPKLLQDRIKSDVFGHRDDVQDVVIKVDGPGQVALKGTVPGPANERELLAAVAEVEGVVDVRSELSVRGA